jgi:hypothetical protein
MEAISKSAFERITAEGDGMREFEQSVGFKGQCHLKFKYIAESSYISGKTRHEEDLTALFSELGLEKPTAD